MLSPHAQTTRQTREFMGSFPAAPPHSLALPNGKGSKGTKCVGHLGWLLFSLLFPFFFPRFAATHNTYSFVFLFCSFPFPSCPPFPPLVPGNRLKLSFVFSSIMGKTWQQDARWAEGRQWRQCCSLGHVLLGKLGSWHSCGCYCIV